MMMMLMLMLMLMFLYFSFEVDFDINSIDIKDIKKTLRTNLIGVFLNPIINLLEDLIAQHYLQMQLSSLKSLFHLKIAKDS